MNKRKLGEKKSSEKGNKKTSDLLQVNKPRGGRGSSRAGDSDSSLDRRSPSKRSLHSNSKRSDGSRTPKRYGSSRLKRDNDSRSKGRHNTPRSKNRSGGRASPAFGGRSSGSEDRLETFGKREEKTRRKNSISLSKLDDDEERRVKTSHDWKQTGNSKRYNKDSLKPASAAGRKPVSRQGDRDRSQRRDHRDGSRDDRSDRKDKRSQHGGRSSNYDDPRYEKHLSAKMSKRRGKSLNFSEKKEKRQKDWILDYKAHRPILHLSDKFEEPAKRTKSYLLTLSAVRNIPVNEIPLLKERGVTPTINY